jgi:hypothetical protein
MYEKFKEGESRQVQFNDWDPDACDARLHNAVKGAPTLERDNRALGCHWLTLRLSSFMIG